jgi:hypothetical protein
MASAPAHRRVPRLLRHVLRAAALVAILRAPPASAAITVDNSAGTFTNSNATSLTLSNFTVGSASNRVLIVGVAIKEVARFTTSSVKFNGTSMTLVGSKFSGANEQMEMYYLLAPASTTASIVLSGTGTGSPLAIGAVSLAGVLQSAPAGFTSANGFSLTPSVTVNGVGSSDMVVDACAYADQTANPTAGASQTSRWIARGAVITSMGSTRPASGSSSVTMSWTGNFLSDWAIGAVRLQPGAPGISGTVFEDSKYGGGAGRDLATATGVGLPGARVELYNSSGPFVSSTTTQSGGTYAFSGLAAGSYTVRVVNDSVSSSRSGYVTSLKAVQTFRTDASSGAAVAITDHVGGQNPSVVDAAAGSAGATMNTTTGVFSAGPSGTAQSITNVALGASDVTGVDFGFGFDVIVNVNDAGQGSLRQFLLNANALANAGLAQAGRTAGIENAIFMLADGTARPGMNTGYTTQFAGGVVTFRPAGALPVISDPVVLDGQTQPGWSSGPILQLSGSAAGASASGLDITAGSSTVRGFVINHFTGTNRAGIRLATAGGNTVQGCWIGTDSTGAGAAGNYQGIRVEGSSNNTIGGTVAGVGNAVRGSTSVGLLVSAGTGNAIEGNAIYGNGGIGIDLAGDGVSLNDGTMNGALPNSGMDFPVFTSSYLNNGSLSVAGYVGSAPGQATFAGARVEVFKSDNDASGYGEGASFLGALTSDGSGNFSGTLTVAGLAVGDRLTATATDASGNSSEFGADSTVRPLSIVKRVFDVNGNAIASGSILAKGTIAQFMLYVDNRGGAVTDLRLSDVLDPTFVYMAGTMRSADVTPGCATQACTAPEESAMLAAALAGTALTDAVDGDTGALSGAAIQVGRANAGSARLDIAAGKVYAIAFRARMQ